jgi:hypothetical protein
MTEDRQTLHDRYLEAQLRDELGPETDISERVLHAVYAKPPRRVIPGPRRRVVWRPLAAAAAVLLAAGLATYALVRILPNELRQRPEQAERPFRQPAGEDEKVKPRPAPATEREQPGKPVNIKDLLPQPNEPLPDTDAPSGLTPVPAPTEPGKVKPDDSVSSEADPSDGEVGPRKDWTDPPESWPNPKKPIGAPDETSPKERAVLVSNWKGESLRVTRDGREQKWKAGEVNQLLDGDRVATKGAVDFILADGGLLRLDGEVTFAAEANSVKLALHDGAVYADTAGDLRIATDKVEAVVTGVAVLEERLHGVDVFCLTGRVNWGTDFLAGGRHARLENDGFGREKAITWAEVQREFQFLKDSPTRTMLVEELAEEPRKLFGGSLVDGVLVGDVDSDVGIGFYLREPYSFRDGDVVRFRFRVENACEMILQFGTVEDANWRHKMGGIKAGEWVEYELPLRELYKTTDVALKAEPGLTLKFFQLHPEDATSRIEIDRVEIVHRP